MTKTNENFVSQDDKETWSHHGNDKKDRENVCHYRKDQKKKKKK